MVKTTPSLVVAAALFVCLVSACDAFTGTHQYFSQGTTSLLRLHPDQAEELVECAQSMMKDSLKEKEEAAKSLAVDISSTLKAETKGIASSHAGDAVPHGFENSGSNSSRGPMSWVRNRVWLLKHRQNGSTAGGIMSSTAMASKKLP